MTSFSTLFPVHQLRKERTLLRTLPQALPLGQESDDEDSLLVETLVSVMPSILSLRSD